jgi:hypothetical protein
MKVNFIFCYYNYTKLYKNIIYKKKLYNNVINMQSNIDKYPPINPYANTRWSGPLPHVGVQPMQYDPTVSWNNPSAVRAMHWDPTENWNSGIPASSLYAMEMYKSRPFEFYDQLTYPSGNAGRRASRRAGSRARKHIHRRGRTHTHAHKKYSRRRH